MFHMIENRSAPPGPVVPVLIYQDVPKAIEWLCGAFGFEERLRTRPEPDGTVHHAQLAVGQGSVMLNGGRGETKSHSGGVMVYVQDVDAHCERAKKFGTKIVNPPATAEFGERQYSAEDPEGNRWTFSQSVADVDPKDWGAQVARIRYRLELLPRPRFCYLEIPALDIKQSVAFYEKVFGWNIRRRDTDHPSFDDAQGNISGAWVTGVEIHRAPGLLASIWVDGIDAVLARIAANGGEVAEAVHPDRPGGTSWIATFRDPAGNPMRLYQEAPRE
jgi:predicted enzyme related to lactoylglutathione lyase